MKWQRNMLQMEKQSKNPEDQINEEETGNLSDKEFRVFRILFPIFPYLLAMKWWCWGWNSNTLAISCQELTPWKRLWCWEGLGAGGEGDDRGWDGWMASLTRWKWVWVNSRSWWWTGKPGVLQFMGSQRVGHDWATKLNWTYKYLFTN